MRHRRPNEPVLAEECVRVLRTRGIVRVECRELLVTEGRAVQQAHRALHEEVARVRLVANGVDGRAGGGVLLEAEERRQPAQRLF